MKVAIYCRVSTDDKGQDPKVQLDKCLQYCELQSHKVMASFMDEGISGDTWYYDRPKGKELHNLIESNKIEGVVCFSIDRFSRQNPMKILPLLDHLKNSGVLFISVTEPVFNLESEFSSPMRYMLTWFSNYFLTQHKKKVNAGLDKAKKDGTKSGKPIGRERKTDYSKILELHIKGYSLSKIAKELQISKGSVHNAIKTSSKVSLIELPKNLTNFNLKENVEVLNYENKEDR